MDPSAKLDSGCGVNGRPTPAGGGRWRAGRRAPEPGGPTGPGAAGSLPGLTADELEHTRMIVRRLWDLADSPSGSLRVPVIAFRHRRQLISLRRSLDRLPRIWVQTGDTPAGREMQRLLLGVDGDPEDGRHAESLRARLGESLLAVPDRRSAVAVLEVPPDPADYLVGRKRHSLRNNLRRAERHGIVVGEVLHGPSQIDCVERVLAARNDDWMSQHGQWLARAVDDGVVRAFAAYGPDGELLNVALVVVDQPWALMRLCVSVDGELASSARYATYEFIVQVLSRSKVRNLLVDSVLDVTPGLRYFQALLGFELMNVTVSRRRRCELG